MGLDLKNIKNIVGLSGLKIKTVQTKSGKVLWKAGAIVTYIVDTAKRYTEEVDMDETCLAPTTFDPQDYADTTLGNGWTFVGWRKDATAESSVESNVVMEGEPITLWAVFKKDVTVTWYDNSGDDEYVKQKYYNNGTVKKPVFTLEQASKDGWNRRGWGTSTAADASVVYSKEGKYEFESDITVYGLYEKEITANFYSGLNKSDHKTDTGTAYHNASGENKDAIITFPTGKNETQAGWDWRGWAEYWETDAEAAVAYANGYQRETGHGNDGITFYGLYSQNIVLSYNGNGNSDGSTSPDTKKRYHNSYGNYSNPIFILKNNGFTRSGYTFSKWASGSTSGTKYSPDDSVTLTANTTFYALWTDNAWTWVNNYVGSGASLAVGITEAKNILYYYPVGTTLSEFKVTPDREVTEQEMSIYFETNEVNTKGCKYMDIEFEDFYTSYQAGDGGVQYIQVKPSGGGTALKEITGRQYYTTVNNIDVSSASKVYLYSRMGAWAYNQTPICKIKKISFHN